ncbi:MAG: photosystem II biosynthesis protein, partial [Desulfobaccales bacterium]
MSPKNSKWHKFLSRFKTSKTKDEKEEQNSKQEDEQKSKQKEKQKSIEKEERARRLAPRGIVIGLVLACGGIILYAWQAPCWAQFFSIIGVALVVANAAFFSGGLLGFLFGIPSKQAQSPGSPAPPPAPPKPPSATPPEPSAKANSAPTPSA